MGLLEDVANHPVAQQFFALGLGTQIAVALAAFVSVSVVLNVASQILFKNPNEPPLVFHWLPFIGSTVTYGMDPPSFFEKNRKKVRDQSRKLAGKQIWLTSGPIH
jgi:sterol 14-demethylase